MYYPHVSNLTHPKPAGHMREYLRIRAGGTRDMGGVKLLSCGSVVWEKRPISSRCGTREANHAPRAFFCLLITLYT